MPKYPIIRFDKGITDFIYKSEDSFSEECDNLVINKNLGVETRFGKQVFNNDYPRVPTEDRITKIFEFQDDVAIKSLDKFYILNSAAGYTEVEGESSRSIFHGHDAEDYVDHDILNNQIIFTSTAYKFRPLLVYKSTSYDVSTVGLPVLAADPTITPAAGAASVSYIYAFIQYRNYTANSLTFEEVGPPIYVQVTSSSASEVDSATPYVISTIPVFTNAANTFYKTGTGAEDMKIKVYRTVNNGSVFYDTNIGDYTYPDLLQAVNNGTVTINDTTNDADLALNSILYTEGGIVDSDRPPISKYVTVAREIAWYANLNGAPNRVRQSKLSQPGACPGSYYVDVDDDITGIGTTRNFPIVFTRTKVFRLEGFIDELGRGDIQKQVITDKVGCINHRTITQTRAGIYFAGTNGWFFTDGYSLTILADQLEKRYPELLLTDTAQNHMSGTYLSEKRQVYFSVQEGADNDKLYVFDEHYNAWTTMSGQTAFTPTAIGTYGTKLIKADDEGYIYNFDDNVLTDIVRDTTNPVADWLTEAIVYDYKHIAASMGDLRAKKWMTKVNLQIDNKTGQHIDVGAFDERSFTRRELKPIISIGALPWGQSGTAWGTSGITWGGNEMLSRTRRFPAGKLRTRFKQISLRNYWGKLFESSSSYGNATPSVSTKYVDLDDTSQRWPVSIVGNTIQFSGAGTEFEILERISDNRIRVNDPGNALPTSSVTWDILGYSKSEKLNLQAITYTYVPLSDRGSYYDSNSEGGEES